MKYTRENPPEGAQFIGEDALYFFRVKDGVTEYWHTENNLSLIHI